MRYRPSFLLKPTACWGTAVRAPNLSALDQDAGGELEAREARREARVVLYPRRGAACPPNATDSRARVERPSEAP
jgi:hypothetical protein